MNAALTAASAQKTAVRVRCDWDAWRDGFIESVEYAFLEKQPPLATLRTTFHDFGPGELARRCLLYLFVVYICCEPFALPAL